MYGPRKDEVSQRSLIYYRSNEKLIIYSLHLEWYCQNTGKKLPSNMHVARMGGKKCIQNFGKETFRNTSI